MIVARLGLIAALLTVSAVATPAVAGKRDNSIRFAIENVIDNVDPYFNTLRTGINFAYHVWDTLIYRDPTTGEYKGQLATAWRQVDDKTIELDLRRGVRFHNGAEFDAVVHANEALFAERRGVGGGRQRRRRSGVLRPADGVRRRAGQYADRAGRDLRAGDLGDLVQGQ